MAPVSEAEGQRSGGRWAHRCRPEVLDVLGRVLLHRLRLTAGRGVGQGIVVTVGPSRTALWLRLCTGIDLTLTKC